jgi:hypothetical protein
MRDLTGCCVMTGLGAVLGAGTAAIGACFCGVSVVGILKDLVGGQRKGC